MWQEVPERVADEVSGLRIADEVAFAARVAPRALRIPVPGLDKQFGVLPIGDRLPSGCKHLVHDRVGKKLVGGSGVEPIDACPKCLGWNKGVDYMARSGINPNGLGGEKGTGNKQAEEQQPMPQA